MKRITVFILVLMLLFSMVGCRREKEEEAFNEVYSPQSNPETNETESSIETPATEQVPEDVPDQPEDIPEQPEDVPEQPEDVPEQPEDVPEQPEVKIVPDRDYTGWEQRKSVDKNISQNSDVYFAPTTFSEILRHINGNASVLIGHAVGERTCFYKEDDWYSHTRFKIDKVLEGDITDSEITILEGFYPYETEKERYLLYDSVSPILRNDQPTLVIAYKMHSEKYGKNIYNLWYGQMPLPKDYNDYSEEYLTELLDYYRNKPGTSTKSAGKTGAEEVTLEDGQEAIIYYGPPKKELNYSNEEMLELMKEQVLVQLAVRYKVKIWPKYHVKFDKNIVLVGNQAAIAAAWSPPN
ncbi:MAG: hypothetical protein IJP27_00130 [Clostridia bacterium]|nr:hypothetical protein [Clostridia bacterium]